MDKTHQGGLRILFADDEAHLRDLMQMELPRIGHEVTVCPDGTAAVKALEKGSFDVALLDIKMPGLTGIEVLAKVRQASPETQVIIMTGHATVDTAVQALRLGAFDYLTKPCKWAELEVLLARVAERRDLTNKAAAFETRLKAVEGTPLLVGDTPSMQAVRRQIDMVAPTDAGVLILGETGTGKELIARNLHDKSKRAGHAFIPVNCGALPENLVESELFGHRKGAFTGADNHRKGLFEVANGGTLFLDEVGELDKSVQVKLLRFLESGEIRRVGENDPFRVDVRVLCATHRDLREMIETDAFREDLFFRINTFEIHPARPPRPQGRHPRAGPAHAPPLQRPAGRPRAHPHPRGDRGPDRPRLARQHPRAGQRHRAGLDPLRRRRDPRRAPPDPGLLAPVRCPRPPASPRRRRPPLHRPRGQPHPPRRRDEVHPGRPGEVQRQQARRRQGTRHRPQDPVQQDQPVAADLRAGGAIRSRPAGARRQGARRPGIQIPMPASTSMSWRTTSVATGAFASALATASSNRSRAASISPGS